MWRQSEQAVAHPGAFFFVSRGWLARPEHATRGHWAGLGGKSLPQKGKGLCLVSLLDQCSLYS